MKSSQNNCPDSLYRALPGRVAELESALQDAYLWAYTSGKLSEIDDLLEKAAVPIPAEIVTRNRMIEVWEEGFKKHHGWTLPSETPSSSRELTWMLTYASMLHGLPALPKSSARECLWKLARAASNLLSPDLDVLARALEDPPVRPR